jgi:hypothetical protein
VPLCAKEGHFLARDESILAYKLFATLANSSSLSNIEDLYLVDSKGFVLEELFYEALTAWFHLDTVTYYVSQAHFWPTPRGEWKYEKGSCGKLDFEREIRSEKKLFK